MQSFWLGPNGGFLLGADGEFVLCNACPCSCTFGQCENGLVFMNDASSGGCYVPCNLTISIDVAASGSTRCFLGSTCDFTLPQTLTYPNPGVGAWDQIAHGDLGMRLKANCGADGFIYYTLDCLGIYAENVWKHCDPRGAKFRWETGGDNGPCVMDIS